MAGIEYRMVIVKPKMNPITKPMNGEPQESSKIIHAPTIPTSDTEQLRITLTNNASLTFIWVGFHDG
jgi:hypothetical protein